MILWKNKGSKQGAPPNFMTSITLKQLIFSGSSDFMHAPQRLVFHSITHLITLFIEGFRSKISAPTHINRLMYKFSHSCTPNLERTAQTTGKQLHSGDGVSYEQTQGFHIKPHPYTQLTVVDKMITIMLALLSFILYTKTHRNKNY